MGDWIKLKADDGHEFSAYVVKPAREPVGAVVVVQEIFGVNKSIRAVADYYAGQGFLSIAPATMDRLERSLDLGYGEADLKKAFGLYPKLDPNLTLLDIAAAFHHAKQEGKPTAVLGFCYGGLTSWVSAVRGENVRMQPDCCVCYYPGGIGKFAKEEPACPVMIHFGGADDHIGKDQVDAVREAHPEVEIYVYDGAGHAFANPDRPSYKGDAAKLADQRSLEFLQKHLA
ncbi:MAG TPA: dienelactone hydrolase family protein [Acidobacteriaceae bacterium]|nr:dienelactone hydrolase family protein [Acidobacteriaceae bacterium]